MGVLQVVGFGAMNLDLLYSVDKVVTEGETAIKSHAKCPGGSAANTIYALAKLDVTTGYVGAIGNDEEGQLLLRSFQSVGVDIRCIKTKVHAATGTVLAITDKLGHRALYISPGANTLLNRKDINPSYFNQASIVYFSPFVGERQFQLQKEIARQLSPQVRLSFAPGALYASRGLKALKTILSRTHILFLNQAEIEQLTGHDFRDGTSICLNEGCQQAVVTFGKGKLLAGVKGTVTDYIRDKNREYFIVPRKARIARVVDTTGAGDAFAAGYLFGFLKGKNPDECGLIGDMVARFSLCRLGARDGLPTRAELSEAYHELYQKTL